MTGIKHFFTELLRRKVMRVAIGYAVVMWLLLQVAEVTFEPLRLPEWALTLMIVIAILGFALAVFFAWAFEVTPGGVQRDPMDVSGNAADDSPPEPKRDEYRSVAVLPFADMSPGRDQAYFCEGIAEEILNTLATVKGLHVPARTSSFRFDTADRDVREIGKALDVEAVLEGSVRKEGGELRITAQLIDARDGYHIWAGSFDRDLSDVFELQHELSREIISRLCASLAEEHGLSVEPASIADIQAYDYYLQGQYFLNRYSKQQGQFAVQMFSRSVELDPQMAIAWAGLAEAHTCLYMHHDGSPKHRDAAAAAAEKAVELAPGSARCKTARGMALMIAGRYREADIEFERALASNTLLFSAAYYYARSCQMQGKLEKAVGLFEQASKRRPDDYQAPLLAMSIYRRLGTKDAARDAARRGTEAAALRLSLHPDDARALCLGGLGQLELGEEAAGRDWIERAIALDPGDALTRYNAACFYAQAGDTEAALANLVKVNKFGKEFADWMDHDPDLDPLRGHRGFEQLRPAH